MKPSQPESLPEDQFKLFLDYISGSVHKPGLLKITTPFAEQFVPRACDSSLPHSLSSLYSPNALHLDYLSLLQECEMVFSTIKVYLLPH